MTPERPDPGALLQQVQEQERQARRGKLKVFFGAAPGVGKTYAMLEATRRLYAEGVDVVIGLVETHGRAETESLLLGLELLPQRQVEYRGAMLREFDLDAALARKPEILILDELAHTNAAGSRHEKRWQDVQALLDAGISVFTTMNVQHVESLNDVVAQITGVTVRETVPDSVLEQADEIGLIDLPPDALLERLRHGKVYVPESIQHAITSFFRKGNLTALRELSLRKTAELVDAQMRRYKREQGIAKVWPASERLLVCVGPSPTSATLLRAAKRMAIGLHAQLIAVYVETPASERLSHAAKDQILHTLRLAQSLGAETVTLSGRGVSQEIITFARARNVSAILVGKPTHRPWWDRFSKSPVDDLIRRSSDLDVFVLRGDAPDEGPELVAATVKHVRSPLSAYAWAAGIVLASSVVAALMFGTGRIDKANIAMVYLLGVLIAAARLGRGPSVTAAVLSVAAFDFFFVPPHLTFAITDTQYLITFAVMLAAGLLISTLTYRIREQARAAEERERRTAALYSMSRELGTSRSLEEIILTGTRHLRETFDVSVAVCVPDERGQLVTAASDLTAFTIGEAERGVLQWAFERGKPAGWGTSTLPSSPILALPLTASNGQVGALGLKPHRPDQTFSTTQFLLLETFANQLALAIERGRLIRDSQQSQLQAETERLRNALLSSVSHDLRTPLAGITGAASTLMEDRSRLTDQNAQELVESIYHESRRLGELIDSLLFATKLEIGAVQPKRDWIAVEEIVGSATARLRSRLETHPLRISLPADLPLIFVDGVLIEQVLMNFLENAAKHTQPGVAIEINAWVADDALMMEVADEGGGLPPGEERRVFDRFYRVGNRAGASGLGLGLTICRGIVRAHGGRIWAENRQPHGASFRFSLPLSATPAPPAVPAEPSEADVSA